MGKKLTIEEMKTLAESRGGKCLSDEYVNSHSKLKWECLKGHEWFSTPCDVKGGHWCPHCASNRAFSESLLKKHAAKMNGEFVSLLPNKKSKWRCSKGHEWEVSTSRFLYYKSWCPTCAKTKHSIEKFQQLAKEKGGKLISKEYTNNKTKMKWKCKNGHEWEVNVKSLLKKDSWCPHCSKNVKLTLDEMKRVAISREGECLSIFYKNSISKLKWRCSKGHEWEATAAMVKGGSWCSKCAKNFPLTIDNLKEYAEQNDGLMISENFKNSKSKMKWRCSKGHEWVARAEIITDKSWCPTCLNKRTLLTIEKIQAHAHQMEGVCLSTVYIPRIGLKWKCNNGHEWEAGAYNVLNNKTWCPTCSLDNVQIGQGESIGLNTLQQSGRTFVKIRPEWLKSEKGNRLEIDAYCEERKIAFEYNGYCHYKYIPFFHKTKSHFLTTRKRDSLKRKVCAVQGIILIQLSEVSNPTEERVRAALVDYCIRHAVPLELNPEYAEMLTLPNYGLKTED